MGGRSSSRGHRIPSRSSARAGRLGGALFLRGIRARGIGLLAQRMLPEPLLIRVSFLQEADPQIGRLTTLTCWLPFCSPRSTPSESSTPIRALSIEGVCCDGQAIEPGSRCAEICGLYRAEVDLRLLRRFAPPQSGILRPKSRLS